jgi:hypothetical protein
VLLAVVVIPILIGLLVVELIADNPMFALELNRRTPPSE